MLTTPFRRFGTATCAVFLWFAPLMAENHTSLAESRLTPYVLSVIRKNYVDPSAIEPQEMLKGALDSLEVSVPEVLAQWEKTALTLTIGQATKKFDEAPLATTKDFWPALRDIYSFIDLNYHGETKRDELEYFVIDGMLKTLDPHSNIFRPKEYRDFKIGTKGNFGGIGTVIGMRDSKLTVISPIDGTPAFRAGLQAKDRIIQIGEDSTTNMNLNEAVEKLRGPVGTQVVLTVERDNHPNFSVALKRAIIRIDSVQSTMIQDHERNIGYLKVKSFQENTMDDLRTQLATLHKQTHKLDGLILDLRNNPGGLLTQAIDMADLFLDDGTIVSTVGANGKLLESYDAEGPGTEPNYPMLVIVNEGSASASEIVTGALQGHHRALILGTPTFGKGSVQQIYDLDDGGGLKMTIAEYLTAGNHSIQEIGVIPDIELDAITASAKYMNLLDDKSYGERDLEKHLKRHDQSLPQAGAKLKYLKAYEEETPDAEDKKEYSSALNLTDDFMVDFAKRLFAEVTPTPGTFWEHTQNVIAQAQSIEDQKLKQALEKLGIVWEPQAESADKPQVQITYTLKRAKKRATEALAGEEQEFELAAKNIGKGTFSQLIGQTESEMGVLSNKEFIFGKLAPGEERRWSVAFKPDKAIPTQHVPVTIKFQEGNRRAPASFKALVPIHGAERPQFAYRFHLGTPSDPKSTISGALPVGRTLPFTIDVKNASNATAPETAVTIKPSDSGKGPYIEAGRMKLGKLAPNESGSAQLKFHLDPAFAGNNFKLELIVADTSLFEAISDTLNFSLANSRVEPAMDHWYQAPVVPAPTGELPAVTKETHLPLHVLVHDDTQVKDLFIFVGEHKVFYQANAGANDHFDVTTDLPLKPGSNLITIAARDDENLIGRRTLSVYRMGDEAAPKTVGK